MRPAISVVSPRVGVGKLRRELISLCDTDPEPTRVVQLNLQLFPLSAPLAAPFETPPSDGSANRCPEPPETNLAPGEQEHPSHE